MSNRTLGQAVAENLLLTRTKERDHLRGENRKMRKALAALVKMYVANLGTDGEFISCITPRHASSMTTKERRSCPVWKAWDDARATLEPQP